MFGIRKKEKCICGEMVDTSYGARTMCFEDAQGEFDCYAVEGENGAWEVDLEMPLNQCPKCGHIINSERLVDAKYAGMICY